MTKMPESEVKEWRERHDIIVQGDDIPKPVLNFDYSPFPGLCPPPAGMVGR